MLTRLYIDNFRCFEQFEFRPEKAQLILGRNGAGKSSAIEALQFIKDLITEFQPISAGWYWKNRCRWTERERIVFEIDTDDGSEPTRYRVVIGPTGVDEQIIILHESLSVAERLLFMFEGGVVHLFDDEFQLKNAYPSPRNRSALSTVFLSPGKRLARFRHQVESLYCFRLDPRGMSPRSEAEQLLPQSNMANFASWMRHAMQWMPESVAPYQQDLRRALDTMDVLRLEPLGDNVSILRMDRLLAGNKIRLTFEELSDGQRCLICLYAIVHFILAHGGTVFIDEPDNFVSLREIQPWLICASDMVDDSKGQLILVSHHPEIINQWAPGRGVQFVEDSSGAIRVKPAITAPDGGLSPAELIARGWDDE